jgi:hypothetical protein
MDGHGTEQGRRPVRPPLPWRRPQLAWPERRFRLPFPNPRVWGDRSEWGSSARAHLGQGQLGGGDLQGRPFSAQEQRREVGGSGDAVRQGRGREQAGRCVAGWASHWSFYSRGKVVPWLGGVHTELVRIQWRDGRRVCGRVNAPLWPCCWTRLVQQRRHLMVCEPGRCSGERRRDTGGGLWPWWRSEVMALAGEAVGSKWWRCLTGRAGQWRSYGGLRHHNAGVLCSQGDGSTAAALVARCGVCGSGDDQPSRRS